MSAAEVIDVCHHSELLLQWFLSRSKITRSIWSQMMKFLITKLLFCAQTSRFGMSRISQYHVPYPLTSWKFPPQTFQFDTISGDSRAWVRTTGHCADEWRSLQFSPNLLFLLLAIYNFNRSGRHIGSDLWGEASITAGLICPSTSPSERSCNQFSIFLFNAPLKQM
jgi:hypothetical protein